MKTLISYFALVTLLLASSSTIANQKALNDRSATASINEECFNYIRVHRQGKSGVSISWSVNSPDIDHFMLERSYDGEFFETVVITGFTGTSHYKTIDQHVYPGTIHYRVKAVKTDGSTETSSVKTVRIVQHG